MNNVENIVLQTRRTGNTTWILKAAINDPHCIIIAKDGRGMKYLHNQYYLLLSKEKWYRRLWWRVFGRKHPSFKTVAYSFPGMDKPIIFDNHSLTNL